MRCAQSIDPLIISFNCVRAPFSPDRLIACPIHIFSCPFHTVRHSIPRLDKLYRYHHLSPRRPNVCTLCDVSSLLTRPSRAHTPTCADHKFGNSSFVFFFFFSAVCVCAHSHRDVGERRSCARAHTLLRHVLCTGDNNRSDSGGRVGEERRSNGEKALNAPRKIIIVIRK